MIALTPDLAFGHYNLGHTLFLQGRYQASLAAYAAGQRNDPARNPVQASRLALARLATGDAAGALRDLQTCTATLPAAYRRQVLGDTQAVAWALLSTTPDLPGWRLVGDWLSAELAREADAVAEGRTMDDGICLRRRDTAPTERDARRGGNGAAARWAGCSTTAACASGRRWPSSSPFRCRCSSTSSSVRSTTWPARRRWCCGS